MLIKALTLRCQCGRPPIRIKEIGLTANHELAVYWHCAACRRPVYAVKPLTECWVDCPTEKTAAPPLLMAPADQDPADREFLRSLGVRLDHPETDSA
jgi:hypothetical protein